MESNYKACPEAVRRFDELVPSNLTHRQHAMHTGHKLEFIQQITLGSGAQPPPGHGTQQGPESALPKDRCPFSLDRMPVLQSQFHFLAV